MNKLAFIGLGYIGLPLSVIFAKKGFQVIGIEKDENIIKKVKTGEPHIYEPYLEENLKEVINKNLILTNDISRIKECEFIFITVNTPIDENKEPNLKFIKAATTEISQHIRKNTIIIIKSTLPPLTTENEIIPLVEKESGLKNNKDFHICFCPERTVEGKVFEEFEYLPKIIGTTSKYASKKLKEILSTFEGPVIEVSSPRIAEMVKLMDNTFRDVNIALANEFAKICYGLNVDVYESILAANKEYSRNKILMPGPGVGGSCLTKDPIILSKTAEKQGVKTKLIPIARDINETMPEEVIRIVDKNIKSKDSKITILGIAFKGDTDDIRGSPTEIIYKGLKSKFHNIECYDNFIKEENIKSKFQGIKLNKNLYEACKNTDCILILTDHSEFKHIDLEKLNKIVRTPIIIDTRHIIDPYEALRLGFIYDGIGRPHNYFKVISKMRVLVTGGAGFIGSHLCEGLIKKGHEVICYDNLWRGKIENIQHLISNKNFTFIKGDITNSEDVDNAVAGCDMVYHLAAINGTKYFYEKPIEIIKTNITGTQNVLESALKHNVKRFIFASTPEVYGEPNNIPTKEDDLCILDNPTVTLRHSYAGSKFIGDILSLAYSQIHSLPVTVVRYFNIYGPRLIGTPYGQVVSIFIKNSLEEKPILIHGEGSQTRSFTYIDDAIECTILAGESKKTIGETINIGIEKETTIIDLAKKVKQISNSKSEIIFTERNPGDSTRRCPNITKVKALLNWEPKIELEDGIKKTIDWFKKESVFNIASTISETKP